MPVGRIKVWLENRRFGFIVTEGDSPDIFVHISQVKFRPIRPGDVVSFDLDFDAQGRPRAFNADRVERGVALSFWGNIPAVRAKKARQVFSEALIARNEKRYEQARRLFEQAISLSPERNFFDAYAAMEKQLGNWNRVDAIYKQAREYFPHDTAILEAFAMAKRKAGNLQECADLLREAIQQEPNKASLHLNLADTLVDLAEYTKEFSMLDEARNHFAEAKRIMHQPSFEERSAYNKMWVLNHKRSRTVWLFLREIGFKFVRWGVAFRSQNPPLPAYAWFLADPSHYKNRELYALDGKVFISCPYASEVTITHVQAAENLHKNFAAKDPDVKQDMFLLVTDSDRLESYLRTLLEDPETHPTVVPLEEAQASKALQTEEDLHSYLDQLLSKWVFQRDLYKGNLPVSGRRFFGREREIALLNQSIDEGRCIGIFGLRKSGKTSLLWQLKLIRKGDVVTYIDPESSPLESVTWICWRAVKDWEKDLKDLKGKLSLSRYRSEKELPAFNEAAQDFVSDLRHLLNILPPDSKCVLMIDEIEKIVPTNTQSWEGSLDFFRLLRGVTQESQGKFIVFMCGANPAICERPQWSGQDNPVFQFFEEMFLPLLSEAECKEMITTLGKGMGIYYHDEDALRFIYDLTGGHPFLTRRLCSALVKRLRERPLYVRLDMLKDLEEEFLITAHDVFLEIRDRLKRDYPNEWELIEALVSGFSLDDIKQLIQNWPIALRHLEGYQIIQRDGSQLIFKIRLLERWLREGGFAW